MPAQGLPLFPHMHLRGKSFHMEAALSGQAHEVLLNVPRYRFDWQNRYVLAEPRPMPEGTVLHCEGRFDNSSSNLNNPNPDGEVRFGVQTWDEMLVGYFDMAPAQEDLREGMPAVKLLSDGRFAVQFHYRCVARHQGGLPGGRIQRLEARRTQDGRPRRARPLHHSAGAQARAP